MGTWAGGALNLILQGLFQHLWVLTGTPLLAAGLAFAAYPHCPLRVQPRLG